MATQKQKYNKLTKTKKDKAKKMFDEGYSLQAIADSCELTSSTVSRLKNEEGWQREGKYKNAKRAVSFINKEGIEDAFKQYATKESKQKRFAAKEIYLAMCGELTLEYIAEKLNTKINLVKRWAVEDAWNEALTRRYLTEEQQDFATNVAIAKEKLTAVDYIKRLQDIAFTDITDFLEFGSTEGTALDEDGNLTQVFNNQARLKDSKTIKNLGAISSVKVGRGGLFELKLENRVQALTKLIDLCSVSEQAKQQLEIQKQKLELEVIRAEHAISKEDIGTEDVENDGFSEAINNSIDQIWGNVNNNKHTKQ